MWPLVLEGRQTEPNVTCKFLYIPHRRNHFFPCESTIQTLILTFPRIIALKKRQLLFDRSSKFQGLSIFLANWRTEDYLRTLDEIIIQPFSQQSSFRITHSSFVSLFSALSELILNVGDGKVQPLKVCIESASKCHAWRRGVGEAWWESVLCFCKYNRRSSNMHQQAKKEKKNPTENNKVGYQDEACC